MRMWLTDDRIAALPTRRRRYLVRDRGLPGLAVRVRSSGGKSFVAFRRTGGKTKKATIGDAARTTVDMAGPGGGDHGRGRRGRRPRDHDPRGVRRARLPRPQSRPHGSPPASKRPAITWGADPAAFGDRT